MARSYKTHLKYVGDRDNWTCWLCNHPVTHKKCARNVDPHRASLDHVVPRSEGGKTRTENLRLAHQSCNAYRTGARIEPFAPIDIDLTIPSRATARHAATMRHAGVATTVDKHYFRNL